MSSVRISIQQMLKAEGQPAGGCQVCRLSVPAGSIVTRVGPLAVVTAEPCVVDAQILGLAFAVRCTARITNLGTQPVMLVAQSSIDSGAFALPSGAVRGRGLGAFIRSLPTAFKVTQLSTEMVGPIRVDPGDSVVLPAPPTGSYWTVADIDPAMVRKIGIITGVVAVGTVAGIGYGAYKTVRDARKRHAAKKGRA